MENHADNRYESPQPPPAGDADEQPAPGIFGRHRWAPFVLPLLVYMALGYFQPEPVPPSEGDTSASEAAADSEGTTVDTSADAGFISYKWYPLAYSVRIAITLAVMALVLPVYRMFQFRVSPWAIACGVLGIVLWVGLTSLELEETYIPKAIGDLLGIGGSRAAYNPFERLDGNPAALFGFLAVRFLGLALIVPIIEEFFIRGFMMRYVQEAQWWQIPIGVTSGAAWAAVILYAALTHPSEMLAAVAWFSLITLLVMRTKNIWDAVAAHAVTNLLLGIYVVTFSQWHLW